eukprot:187262_1
MQHKSQEKYSLHKLAASFERCSINNSLHLLKYQTQPNINQFFLMTNQMYYLYMLCNVLMVLLKVPSEKVKYYDKYIRFLLCYVIGIELEDFSEHDTAASQWEQRILGYEFMIRYIPPAAPFGVLHHGSGWYKINWKYASYGRKFGRKFG